MKSISAEDAIRVLNEALECDGESVRLLIENRVPCNEKMVEHPSIQCGKADNEKGGEVGMLGIINGIFGTQSNGWGYICAHYDSPGGKIVKFAVTNREESV